MPAPLMTMDLSFPLQEFVELFPPPQAGRIAESESFDAHETFDIPRGAVLKFKRKVNPSIALTTCDPSSAGALETTTVPLEFPGRFCILPYDPISKDESPDHIYHTVADLIEAFPLYVQANCSYGRNAEDPKCSFECGDRFKLNRLVFVNGARFLECRLLEDGRLRLLSFDSIGDFTVLPDNTEYTLADIAALPPRKRRLQLTSRAHDIPGLSCDSHRATLLAEEPESFIEASLPDGLIIGLPSDIDMDIIPDESTFDRGQLLNSFSSNSRSLFPVVARVVDWDEETSILENHFIKPGVELVIHGWSKQSKVIACSGDKHYAIPLTYQGKFRIQPRRFTSVSELERVYPGHKIRCTSVDDPHFPICPGDVIRIRRNDSIHKGFSMREIPYIKCEKLDENGAKSKDIKLPMKLNATFEEALEGSKADEYSIKDMVALISDQELAVELISSSRDQRLRDRDLPLGQTIHLTEFVTEPAVYVSLEMPDAPAFHLPLRTHLYVVFVEQLERSCSPLLTKKSPKLSTLDRCAEVLSQESYVSLRAHIMTDMESEYGAGRMETTPQHWQATAFHSNYPSTHSDGLTKESASDELSRQRRGSGAESDIVLSKSKGFGSKLKGSLRLRRHRSTENVFKDRENDFAPSTFNQSGQVNKNPLFDNIGAEMEVSNRNGDVIFGAPNLDLNNEAPVEPVSPSASQHDRPGSVFTDDAIPSTSSSASSPMHSPIPSTTEATQQKNAMNGFDAKRPLPSRSTSVQDMTENIKITTSNNSQRLKHAESLPSVQTPSNHFMLQNCSEGQNNQMVLPPGYALVPMGMQNGQQTSPIPPGYALVPMMPQLFGAMMNFSNSPQQNGGHEKNDEVGMESSEDDGETKSTFKMKKGNQFKVVIPNDGNLYHFSSRKMAEFLRQLKMEPPVIKACLKNKIDGKKFSQLQESDMERLGIFHPVVAHFRSLTFKKRTPSINGSLKDFRL